MSEKKKKSRAAREIQDVLYKLRTEGMSPGKQAAAVALGVFIGVSPLYGLHLALCLLFARLFRLNPGLTYLAAHISLPGVTPFPSQANMILARVPDSKAAFEGMKARGVLVKNVAAMPPLLANCLRLTVGTPLENGQMMDALKASL